MRNGPKLSLLFALALTLPSTAADERDVALDPFGLGLGGIQAQALERAIASGAWRDAEAVLFEAAIANPENAALQRALGVAHYQAGRPYPAAAALKRADSLTPLDPEARFLLASSFLRLERRHWARAELEHLLEAHPNRQRYQIALARVHYDDQRFQDGVDLLSRATEGGSGSAEVYDLLGQCKEGLGRADEAEAAYRKAVTISVSEPAESPWPHFHLGSLMHDLGKLDQAEASFRTAASIDPGNAPAHHELGLVLSKRGRLKASAAALETASRLAPNDATIVYALAGVYRRLGLGDRSASLIRRFRELSHQGGQAGRITTP